MESSVTPSLPVPVTARDLRRHREFAPGGDRAGDVVRQYLPLVWGTARRLLPPDSPDLDAVVASVFQAFALQWRRIPRRAGLAAWFLRSTWFAVRQGARARLAAGTDPHDALRGAEVTVAWLLKLKPKFLDPLLLGAVMGWPNAGVAEALRQRERRVERLLACGLTRLGKRLKRRKLALEAPALLAGLCEEPPSGCAESLLPQLAAPLPRKSRPIRLHGVLRAWAWLRVGRLLGRLARAAGVTVAVLAVSLATFVYLAQHGFLTGFFIGMNGRQIAKEFPELLLPARPWPDPKQARPAAVPASPPRNSDQLYRMTNIWTARLEFTPSQWKGIAPSRVTPVHNMMGSDGQIVLRNPAARRSGLAGVIGFDFNWTQGQLMFAGTTFSNVAVRYRGNGTYVNSLYGPKQSLKVDLNKYRKGQSLGGVHTLNLVNSIPDDSYLHDAMAQRLFRELGVIAPRTSYAYVTVDVPGVMPDRPLGLFVMVENLDSDFALDRWGTKAVPIFKPVTPQLFRELGSTWKDYADIYDLKTVASPAQLQRVVDFAKLTTSADDATFAARLGEFLDLESFAGFLAGHVLTSSYDGFLSNGQNLYLYLDPRSNRFGFIPWDQDHGWGEFRYVGSVEGRERASIWRPCVYEHRFLSRVLKVEAFREIYRRRLTTALDTLFTAARLNAQIDELAALIRPAVAAESDFRLRRFDTAISTNWVGVPLHGPPEGPKSPVHQMKRFITKRAASVRDQLDGKSEGEFLGRHDNH